jgi:hypothetical protein
MQTFPELIAIDRCLSHTFVIGDNPTHLVIFTVRPEQSSYLPDIVSFSTVGAAMKLATAIQRERNNVVVLVVVLGLHGIETYCLAFRQAVTELS